MDIKSISENDKIMFLGCDPGKKDLVAITNGINV